VSAALSRASPAGCRALGRGPCSTRRGLMMLFSARPLARQCPWKAALSRATYAAAAASGGAAVPAAPPAPAAAPSRHHSLNVNGAVDKAFEGRPFRELALAPVSALQGLAGWTDEVAAELRPAVKTIADLGKYKYFTRARAICQLAELESAGHHSKGSQPNVNKALKSQFVGTSLREILKLPPSAMQGLNEKQEAALARFGISTVGDLGAWKFAVWAQAINALAKLEGDA